MSGYVRHPLRHLAAEFVQPPTPWIVGDRNGRRRTFHRLAAMILVITPPLVVTPLLTVTLVAFAAFRLCVAVPALIAGQRPTDIVGLAELALLVAADEALVGAGVDQFA